MIELSDSQPLPAAAALPVGTAFKRSWIFGLAAAAGLFLLYLIYHFAALPATSDTTKSNKGRSSTTQSAPKALNTSEALPVTIDAGDTYYERVYSVVKTVVESTGEGKGLITLTIGLNFKGSINALLSSDKFRLIADELPGPMAPANYLGQFANARSYVEGDIKFELSDQIRRFTIVIEGKEDKRWNFSR